MKIVYQKNLTKYYNKCNNIMISYVYIFLLYELIFITEVLSDASYYRYGKRSQIKNSRR